MAHRMGPTARSKADQAGELPPPPPGSAFIAIPAHRDRPPGVSPSWRCAFCSGSLGVCETIPELLAEAGAVVVSADYPLAPESSVSPCAADDLRALKNSTSRVRGGPAKVSRQFVAGEESWRRNLGASSCPGWRVQTSTRPISQLIAILLSPILDPAPLHHLEIRRQPEAGSGRLQVGGWLETLSRISDKAAYIPTRRPLQSQSSFGLPPALIVSAQDDPMRDESFDYATRLRESGVAVRPAHVELHRRRRPDALCEGAAQADSGWGWRLRDQFIQFFADSAARLRRPASRSLVQASSQG